MFPMLKLIRPIIRILIDSNDLSILVSGNDVFGPALSRTHFTRFDLSFRGEFSLCFGGNGWLNLRRSVFRYLFSSLLGKYFASLLQGLLCTFNRAFEKDSAEKATCLTSREEFQRFVRRL